MSNETYLVSEFPAGKAKTLITKIQKIARENGSEARIVGGAVRDWLLGKPVRDLDMAVNMPIIRFIDILNKHKIKFYKTGVSHGTITVVQGDVSIEITQTRVDVKSDGRHSDVEPITDWAIDSNRRDFSVNAIYLTEAGTLYDPHDGLSDIQNKTLKFIGSADARIEEDHLRILRAFRFLACLKGFMLPNTDIQAIKRHCQKLKTLSKERVTDEIAKLLAAKNPIFALNLAQKIGLDKRGFGFDFFLNNLKVPQLKRAFLHLDWIARLAAITPMNEKNTVYGLIQFSRQQQKRFEHLMIGITKTEATLLTSKDWKKIAYWHATDIQDKARIYAIKNGFIFSKSLRDNLDKFKKPNFPISGEDLKKLGWKSGPILGKKLLELENMWVANDFELPLEIKISPKYTNNDLN